MDAGKLKDRLRFEALAVAQDPKFKSALATWTEWRTVWGEVQDILPSRGEQIADGMSLSLRPARIRTRYQAGANSAMRVVVLGTPSRPERTLRIVSGPAELGRMEGMEFVCEDWGDAGRATP